VPDSYRITWIVWPTPGNLSTSWRPPLWPGHRPRVHRFSFQYVVCIKNGRAYRGHPVIRCNVNFGDPHVVAYCSVISAGPLVTTQQDPSIPCKPDPAAPKPLLFPSAQ
jgi:hypothetical protein